MADSLRLICVGPPGFVDAAGCKQHLVAIGSRTGRNLERRVQTECGRSRDPERTAAFEPEADASGDVTAAMWSACCKINNSPTRTFNEGRRSQSQRIF